MTHEHVNIYSIDGDVVSYSVICLTWFLSMCPERDWWTKHALVCGIIVYTTKVCNFSQYLWDTTWDVNKNLAPGSTHAWSLTPCDIILHESVTITGGSSCGISVSSTLHIISYNGILIRYINPACFPSHAAICYLCPLNAFLCRKYYSIVI